MRRLLLISNSTSFGSGYLDHCETEMNGFLGSKVETITFIPFASTERDSYVEKARERFERMGYGLVSVHDHVNPAGLIKGSQAVFIGGGNTFLLLKSMYEAGIIEAIRERVAGGMPYMGTSAGSNVACATINTTNDMPIVYPPSFDALGLVPFALNPHYIDPASDSTHKGETRQQRIDQFHDVCDLPVVGLRESGILLVEGDRMEIRGARGVKLFRKGLDPVEFGPGSDLSFLL